MYDVVFNPEVLTRCAHPKFKDMVVDTAIDGVCSNFKVNLDKASKKFPKMKFKGTPSSSVIRKRVAEVKTFFLPDLCWVLLSILYQLQLQANFYF